MIRGRAVEQVVAGLAPPGRAAVRGRARPEAPPEIPIATSKAPKWGLPLVIGLIAVVAVRLHELYPPLAALRPALVLGVGGFLALWLATGKSRRRSALRDPAIRWVMVYAAWTAVTIPFALWQGLAFSTFRAVLPAVLLVIAVLLLPPSARTLQRLVAGFVVATGIYAVVLLVLGKDAVTINGSLDANDLALVIALTLPLAIGLAMRTPGWRRLLFSAVAVLLVVATTATSSRGGTIALVVGALVFLLGQPGYRKFLLLAAMIVVGTFAWNNATPRYRKRVMSVVNGEEDYNYTAYGGRKQIWQRARMYTLQHPLFGVGAGCFPVAEGDHLEEIGTHGKWSATHNAYLQAFSELGIPGGLYFIAMFGAMALRAARFWPPGRRRSGIPLAHQPELFAALMAFAAGSYFLSEAYAYFMFTLFGIVALADRVVRQSSLHAPAPNRYPQRRGSLA